MRFTPWMKIAGVAAIGILAIAAAPAIGAALMGIAGGLGVTSVGAVGTSALGTAIGQAIFNAGSFLASTFSAAGVTATAAGVSVAAGASTAGGVAGITGALGSFLAGSQAWILSTLSNIVGSSALAQSAVAVGAMYGTNKLATAVGQAIDSNPPRPMQGLTNLVAEVNKGRPKQDVVVVKHQGLPKEKVIQQPAPVVVAAGPSAIPENTRTASSVLVQDKAPPSNTGYEKDWGDFAAKHKAAKEAVDMSIARGMGA
jgi:hypothetical protein